jgi:hypothetical protein
MISAPKPQRLSTFATIEYSESEEWMLQWFEHIG